MLDTLCALPLSADLFAQAVHPSEPLVAVGLSSGHVQTLKLPPVDQDGEKLETPFHGGRRGSNGTDVVATVWRSTVSTVISIAAKRVAGKACRA